MKEPTRELDWFLEVGACIATVFFLLSYVFKSSIVDLPIERLAYGVFVDTTELLAIVLTRFLLLTLSGSKCLIKLSMPVEETIILFELCEDVLKGIL